MGGARRDSPCSAQRVDVREIHVMNLGIKPLRYLYDGGFSEHTARGFEATCQPKIEDVLFTLDKGVAQDAWYTHLGTTCCSQFYSNA